MNLQELARIATPIHHSKLVSELGYPTADPSNRLLKIGTHQLCLDKPIKVKVIPYHFKSHAYIEEGLKHQFSFDSKPVELIALIKEQRYGGHNSPLHSEEELRLLIDAGTQSIIGFSARADVIYSHTLEPQLRNVESDRNQSETYLFTNNVGISGFERIAAINSIIEHLGYLTSSFLLSHRLNYASLTTSRLDHSLDTKARRIGSFIELRLCDNFVLESNIKFKPLGSETFEVLNNVDTKRVTSDVSHFIYPCVLGDGELRLAIRHSYRIQVPEYSKESGKPENKDVPACKTLQHRVTIEKGIIAKYEVLNVDTRQTTDLSELINTMLDGKNLLWLRVPNIETV